MLARINSQWILLSSVSPIRGQSLSQLVPSVYWRLIPGITGISLWKVEPARPEHESWGVPGGPALKDKTAAPDHWRLVFLALVSLRLEKFTRPPKIP
jgi:hypothetical protein